MTVSLMIYYINLDNLLWQPLAQRTDRGTAYFYLGENQQAIADYSKAIELDPNYTAAYYNRAHVYKLQGEKAQAIADLEKVILLTDDPQLIEMARQQIEELGD